MVWGSRPSWLHGFLLVTMGVATCSLCATDILRGLGFRVQGILIQAQ